MQRRRRLVTFGRVQSSLVTSGHRGYLMMPQSAINLELPYSCIVFASCRVPYARRRRTNPQFAIRNPQFYVAGKDLVKKR